MNTDRRIASSDESATYRQEQRLRQAILAKPKRSRGWGGFLVSTSLAGMLALSGPAIPQEAKLLQRVQVIGGAAGTCPSVFVAFDKPIRFQSVSFSPDRRTATVLLARNLGAERPDADAGLIETYPDQNLPGDGDVSISLDTNRTNPILTLRFSTPVDLDASQAGESSIVFLNIRPAGATVCGTRPSPVVTSDATTAQEGPADEIERDFQDARQAIIGGDYSTAIRLLTRLLEQPQHERSEEAQELLGLSRERNGQLAQARAEYETYLAKYPNSDGANRVRQRLAGVMTAQAQPQTDRTPEEDGEAEVLAGLPEQELPPVRDRRVRSPLQPIPIQEEEPEPSTRGFLSSYYYRSQGSTVFTEFDTDTTDTDDEVFNDTLVTSLDFQGEFETESTTNTWRIAGEHELDFADGGHQFSLSRAYMGVTLKESGLGFKFGRQSQNEGGIQGRFDGLEVTYPLNGTTIAAVVGSPVESSRDGIYENEKLLFGLRAKREDLRPGLDGTIYAVHQVREGYTDRQAVGVELQYQQNQTSVVGILDYDTYFNKVAFARVSGTWLRPDQSSFSVTVDHVHSPSLSFSNALTGQTATTLEELSATYSEEQMKGLALDRTQNTSSLTLAYSRPVNTKWQFSVDGSAYYTSGTPASGGVAAQPSPGTEYFGSIQFVGTGIFADNDTISMALRYANTSTSDLVLLDTYRRSNTGGKTRWKPRLQVGYRQFTDGSTETFAVPSVNMTYKASEQTNFEVELGARFSNRDAPSFSEEANEVFVTAGFNRQF